MPDTMAAASSLGATTGGTTQQVDVAVVGAGFAGLSSPGVTGRSSTPRLLGSIAGVSGILGRPVEPGDDSGGCFSEFQS